MIQKQLKLGFIGGGIGSIAGYSHFVAARMDGLFEITAGVFSSNPEKNRESAKLYGVSMLFDDYHELIAYAQKHLDAVVVLTPTPKHASIVLELIRAGVNVICEKALASSVEDALAIQQALQEQGTFLAVTYNYSGYAMVRELKARVDAGELGQIYQIRLKMPQESFVRPPKSINYPQPWRRQDQFIPTICLDLGVHMHHLAYYVAGFEAQRVFARMKSFSTYGVVDDVEMLMEGKRAEIATFWMSKVALGHRNGLTIEVFGSKASGVWVQEDPERLYLFYTNGQKVILDRGSDLLLKTSFIYNRMTPGHPSGFIEAFANIYYDIAYDLQLFKMGEKRESVFDIEIAIQGLQLLHQARKSSDQQVWMEV
ncbi:MAG: Gfo/Idh/MocA family oxidoreductase [Campylobacterales bacterium]